MSLLLLFGGPLDIPPAPPAGVTWSPIAFAATADETAGTWGVTEPTATGGGTASDYDATRLGIK